MKNKQSQKFIVLVILLIISRCFDAITTYYYTPDLTHEANLFVSKFHFGWMGVILLQIIGLLLIIYCLYYYCFKPLSIPKILPGTKLLEFIQIFYYGKRISVLQVLYKIPKSSSLLYSLGYIATYSAIFIGFLIGTSSTLLIFCPWYKDVYRILYETRILFVLTALIAVIVVYQFFRKELNSALSQE